jgi:LmbE family N-acetylglucosaminyl deacetylase
MKILYVYPHPDDESFGPAPVMSKQRREGHEVYLLTLTKGGATKQRHRLGLSVEEMGDVRYEEMHNVARTLDLSGMTILDLPDSGLKELDPRHIEMVVDDEVCQVRPHVIVSYPVHGISGFHDHLIAHAIVKRVFVDLRGNVPELQRLAFHTITEDAAALSPHFPLSGSTDDEIDCIIEVGEHDVQAGQKALDCYVTFQETIDKSGARESVGRPVVFELFDESHTPPLTDLFAGLDVAD